MNKKNNLHLQAGGVVFVNNQVVIRKSKRMDYWIFPKGHVESNESLEDTALREVLEETGITAKIIDKIDTIFYEFESEPYELTFFLMDHVKFRRSWLHHKDNDTFLVNEDEALSKLSFPAYKDILEKAIKLKEK